MDEQRDYASDYCEHLDAIVTTCRVLKLLDPAFERSCPTDLLDEQRARLVRARRLVHEVLVALRPYDPDVASGSAGETLLARWSDVPAGRALLEGAVSDEDTIRADDVGWLRCLLVTFEAGWEIEDDEDPDATGTMLLAVSRLLRQLERRYCVCWKCLDNNASESPAANGLCAECRRGPAETVEPAAADEPIPF